MTVSCLSVFDDNKLISKKRNLLFFVPKTNCFRLRIGCCEKEIDINWVRRTRTTRFATSPAFVRIFGINSTNNPAIQSG